MYFQNVRGLNTKIMDLYICSEITHYDFIALVETWLNDSVSSSELFSNKYNVYRSDRDFLKTNSSRGGGVLLAVRSTFQTVQIDLSDLALTVAYIDIVGCRCRVKASLYCIYVLYIPPQVSTVELELFLENFEQLILTQNQSNIIILGDFNIPGFINGNTRDPGTRVTMDFINFLNLSQINDILNSSLRILDLVISNVDCVVSRDRVPIIREDLYHPALSIQLKTDDIISAFPANNGSGSTPFNFKKANFVGLYNELSMVDWSVMDAMTSVNELCDTFYAIIYSLCNKYVPRYGNVTRRFPCWFTSDIKYLLKLKYYYHKKFRRSGQYRYYQEFSRLRREVKRMSREAYNLYRLNVEGNICSDPARFWSFIHHRRGTSRIPGLVTYDGRDFDSPLSIVNAFAHYFGSVYTHSGDVIVNDLGTKVGNSLISIAEIREVELLACLRKFPNKMTAGHDLIPSFLVRDCAQVFVVPLLKIFNLSIESSSFPEMWKLAKVCPVLKSGGAQFVSNYRPISILCNFAKAFEMSVYGSILLQVKPLISPYQHGFLEKRSTITNLAIIKQFICESMDCRKQVDVIYTDFSKAFDRIDHVVLLNKLITMGFSPDLINFFSSYLKHRPNFVAYYGFRSGTFISTSGVPQGSNLGPLLFNLFINDLSLNLQCPSLLFADDLKIYATISSIDECYFLQTQLNRIDEWCLLNKLSLNISKCKVCSYTRNQSTILFFYKLGGTTLQHVDAMRDLGVLFDSGLSFGGHVENITKQALKMLGFIIRNCSEFSSVTALKILYFSFVRSRLEYGSLIWYPVYNIYKEGLEKIQRRFLKFLAKQVDGIYPPRGIDQAGLLLRFSVNSLEKRRILASLIFLYKLLNNGIDSSQLLSLINLNVPQVFTRHPLTFYLPNVRTNILLGSPVTVMCRNFNMFGVNCDIFHLSLASYARSLADAVDLH